MKEIVETVKLDDGQLAYRSHLEFESDFEAEGFLNNMRAGLEHEDVQQSIYYFTQNENRQKFAHVFAHLWVLINIARQSESHKDFEAFLKYNDVFYKLFEASDPEILKILVVFLDISSKTRVRKYASTKEVKKRLQSVKDKMLSLLPADFKFYPLDKAPEMQINTVNR